MKPYLLFAGHNYYPRGGAEDFRAFGDSIEELQELYTKSADAWSRLEGSYPNPWGQIVETSTMEIVLWDRGKKGWRDSE